MRCSQQRVVTDSLWVTGIGVREGILLGGRKKIALKITVCPKNKQFALKLTSLFNPNGV